MIIDPDFPDHWKTRTLVGLLDGDECAPVYVIRLWAHCQNRRKDTFENLTSEALKALCRFPGHANKLESSLAASGFIRRSEGVLVVLNWAEYNSSLIAAWQNGSKGGRPAKPTGYQRKKPTGSENTDNGKPTGYPTGSRVDKSREDQIREEKTSTQDATVPRGFRPLGEMSLGSFFDNPETRRLLTLWGQTSAIDEIRADSALVKCQGLGWTIEKINRSIEKSYMGGWRDLYDPDQQRGKPAKDYS